MITDCTGCIIYERRCTNSFLIRLIAMLPRGITVFPNCFVAERRAIWWLWGLIAFTFVSKTKSDFSQRRSSSDDQARPHLSLGNAVSSEIVYFYTFTIPRQNRSADLYVREWSLLREVVRGATNSGEVLKMFKPRLGNGQNVLYPLFTLHRRVVQAGCVIAYKECRWCSTT